MKYNFDEIIERRQTNAMNTDGFRSYIFHAGPEKKFPFADDEFVRMWVADMEFETPPEVCQAIKDRVDKRIFGYTQVFDPKYYDAISTWCKRLYDWEFPKEELTFSPGIIPALYELVGDILEPDEKMIINTPSYGFFKHSATYNNRELVHNDLKNNNGYFTIDFEDLEKKAADSKTKLLIWCNPHNPTGRMWTESELKKVADIVEKYDLWIISDEIHCDLIRQGKKHIPMGKVMPTYNKLITCMAVSKTFNMAGLMFSNIIIRDSKLRQTFKDNDKNIGFVNPISLVANQAAYEIGGEWLEQLKSYLDSNFKYVQEYLAKNLPNAVFSIPEATYLAWVDLRNCIPDIDDLATFFANEAGVLLEGGNDLFVGNAEGFIRLNLAMPKVIIEEGLKRIVEAINKHNGK
jgi:cystathionine beta-lyase